MTHKQPAPKSTSMRSPRPGQDILVASKSSQFPGVGVTLPSYRPKAPAAPSGAKRASGNGSRKTTTSGATSTPRKGRNKRKILKRIFIGLAIIGLLYGCWVGGKFLYNAHKLFGGNIFSVLQTTKLKGEDKGRVNILLAGNSADDVGHNGAELTDSIMLISIDTVNHKAFMLSIPRDLWVDVPDDGHQKINSVYVVGKNNDFKENNFPEGGMGQLEQVVEENFGIDINYYALVNYNALRQAVDAVGGVDYTVKSSDSRGLYDPNIDYTNNGPLVKLPNGVHHLNGQQALNLARARGDSSRSYGFAGSDFDRTKHQRELLLLLKSKAVSAGVLANPAKLSSLSDAIGGNVKTDLSLSEVRRLYDITKGIGGSAITSVGLNNVDGKSLLDSYRSPNGQSAQIPAAGLDDFQDIQSYIQRLTSNDPRVQEGATVVVLNATDTQGLAGRVRTVLSTKNVNVTSIGDAQATQAKTTIIDNSDAAKPSTKKLLQQLYGNTSTTVNPYSENLDADFIILVGNDQINKQT